MPLRECGQFVKVPSIFLKRIRFVRTYEIRGGVSIPKRLDSTLDTRLMGPVQLNVHYKNLKSLEKSAHCSSRNDALLLGRAVQKTQ